MAAVRRYSRKIGRSCKTAVRGVLTGNKASTMLFMDRREAKRKAQRMQSDRDELIERMARALPEDGLSEVFPGLCLGRASQMTEMQHYVFQPAFCVIAQGSKQVLLGDDVFRYDPWHYLISTDALPVISQVAEASDELPYFSFRLDLDAVLVASVIMESGVELKRDEAGVKAMDVSAIDADMLDAVVRLARLLDRPD